MTTAIDNRGGPAHRTNEAGNLVYIHPLTNERFISCTTAMDFIESQGLSLYWRPGLAAKTAFEQLPRLVAAYRVKVCGRAYKKCDHDFRTTCADCPCGACRECLTKEMAYRHFTESRRRADEGSALHDWIKHWVLSGGQLRPTDDMLQPYVRSFLGFIAAMHLTPESFEMTEATVLNRAQRWGSFAGWGGTLDAQVRFDATAGGEALKVCRKFGLIRPLVTLDWKSREGEGAMFWPSNAKQLAAYHRGEVVLMDDGTEVPLPRTDGGVVVQLRPDGWSWRRVDTGPDVYEEFLRNCATATWEIERGPKVTQVKTFPDLDIPDLPKPARKTARKAAARPAATTPAAPRTNGARPALVGAVVGRPGRPGEQLTDSDIPF